jgi:DNA-binding NtrC family response regulator
MATAYAEVDNAVKALKTGAFDYLTKPLQLPELIVTVQKALDTLKLRRNVRALQEQVERTVGKDAPLGESPVMKQLVSLVEKVSSAASTTVLLEGESGSGKEVIARLIHQRTPSRSGQAFIELNCAGVPEALLESELMGHVRGAFTDARSDKEGLLEVADGGTVFLDEIGEMPLGMQAKLLRVLETSKFRRVGGVRDLTVDVRFIAATNRDLNAEVEAGRFRLDLYHRLDVFRLHLPALRERTGDVLPLARRFLGELCRKLGKAPAQFSPEAEAALLAYEFPGNVRELRNAVERAVILENGPVISREAIVLGKEIRASPLSSDPAAPSSPIQMTFRDPAHPPSLEEVEKEYLIKLLGLTGGNRTQVAKLMGVSYPTVVKKITDYQVDVGAVAKRG